jgi:hypothetical protein
VRDGNRFKVAGLAQNPCNAAGMGTETIGISARNTNAGLGLALLSGYIEGTLE